MPPALYVLWRLGGRAVGGFFRVRPAAALLLSLAGVGGILAHACALRDRTTETILHMYHEIGRGRWEEAIRVREKASPASRHTVYLANIALCEAGRMPYEMFRYAQFGPAGLFLDREVSYFSYTFLGEIYFRLGMMQAAEHCAYESLVAWSQKPTAQTLARLAETTLARGDLAACEKYLRFFERTLFYRQWAGERRALVEALRRDPQTAMGPEPAAVAIPEPFFLNYNAPEAMMRKILEGNPRHRKVFEYLMAYYMLSKDPVSAKTLMDRYYAAFDYPSTPPSFEEALLAYEQATDQPAGYPVSEASRERFRAYLQAARTGAGKAWMEKRYGQTYWYYLYYVQPEALHTSSDSNRY
jgi:hypothetical protein